MHLADRLGYGADAALLVLHSDDVGCSPDANRATFELMDKGRITSGSVLIPAPDVDGAVAYQRAHPEADFGVHLTLTSEHPNRRWAGILGPEVTPTLHDADGYLPMTVAEVIQRADPEEAARELRAQVETALDLGIDVTHLDSHMGTVFHRSFLPAWTALAVEFELPTFISAVWGALPPVVAMVAGGIPLIDELIFDTYGPDRAAKESLFPNLLGGLKPGFNHFLVHPARDTPQMRATLVGWETRIADYELFAEGALHESLAAAGVKLTGYRELRDAIRRGRFRS